MDKPCQFCNSPTRLIEGDYYDRADATEKVKSPCCAAQKRNMDYLKARYDPRDPNRPDLDEISKYDA